MTSRNERPNFSSPLASVWAFQMGPILSEAWREGSYSLWVMGARGGGREGGREELRGEGAREEERNIFRRGEVGGGGGGVFIPLSKYLLNEAKQQLLQLKGHASVQKHLSKGAFYM